MTFDATASMFNMLAARGRASQAAGPKFRMVAFKCCRKNAFRSPSLLLLRDASYFCDTLMAADDLLIFDAGL